MVIVLKIVGVPYDATTRDLKEFFRGLKIREEDIHLGRDKGAPVGFAVFSDDDAARRATTRSGHSIGSRQVTVMLSSAAEMDSVLSRKSMGYGSRGSPPRRGRGGFGPSGVRGRGRGRGLAMGPDRFHFNRSDRDVDSRQHERPFPRPSRTERPVAPVEFKSPRAGRPRGSGLDEIERRTPGKGELDDFSDKKFVKLSGLPYTVTDLDVQNFFKGILTREVYLTRHKDGRFEGRPNGEAIIEFFSEQDTREALDRDGRRFGTRIAAVVRPRSHEIKDAIRYYRPSVRLEPPERRSSFEAAAPLPALPKNRDQLANLLQLFRSMIEATDQDASLEPEPKVRRKDQVEDPVIRRVARNANINMRDIGDGKVVGIRNLPFSVTPEEVITFFRGYGAIPDSVRIHYSEDGKSSGDAIITFRTTRDADRAINNLNRKPVGRRKVELFIM